MPDSSVTTPPFNMQKATRSGTLINLCSASISSDSILFTGFLFPSFLMEWGRNIAIEYKHFISVKYDWLKKSFEFKGGGICLLLLWSFNRMALIKPIDTGEWEELNRPHRNWTSISRVYECNVTFLESFNAHVTFPMPDFEVNSFSTRLSNVFLARKVCPCFY